jgi:flagellar protein FliJ
MYKFPLQPVLNHRKLVEEDLQKKLAVLRRVVADEKQRLKTFKKTKNNLIGEMKQKQREGIAVSEMLMYLHFLDCLSRDLEKQKEVVLEVERRYEESREGLIAAMKNRKILGRLKEKQEKIYKYNLIRTEQSFFDELSTNAFTRSS